LIANLTVDAARSSVELPLRLAAISASLRPARFGTLPTDAGTRDPARHQTIQFRPLAPVTDWSFREGGRESRVALASHYSTNSADAALWHAEHDGGLTLAPSYRAVDAVQAGRLRIVLETFEPAPLPIHFVCPSSRLLSAKVRTFVELGVAT
jgi:DNA-binding transcriptional LysR family regulator